MANARIIRGTNNPHKFDNFYLNRVCVFHFILFPSKTHIYIYISMMAKSYISHSIKCTYNGGNTFCEKKKKETEAENKVAEEIV